MDTEYTPFDLNRMFLGDEFSLLFIAEILVRTAIMYLSALLLVRFIGKRGLGQLSPFEYLVVIAMGSAAGDPMFYPDIPLIHGIVVLATIVLLQKGLIQATERSPAVEHFVESVPAMLVREGELLEEKLWQEGLNKDELFARLRQEGVANLSEVRLAYLEPSGAISVFRKDRYDPSLDRTGESTLPQATS